MHAQVVVLGQYLFCCGYKLVPSFFEAETSIFLKEDSTARVETFLAAYWENGAAPHTPPEFVWGGNKSGKIAGNGQISNNYFIVVEILISKFSI